MKGKKHRNIWIAIALILSHGMCLDVAYNYRGMICGMEHQGFSAPPYVALFVSIPYLLGLMVLYICMKFSNRRNTP